MADRVRIGFLGTGGIAGHHLRQLAEIETAEIVALCDIDEERVRSRTEEFGGTAYADFDAMLDGEELDAIYFCIPPFAHTDQEIKAAQRGLHVFVEKPVSLTVEKGLEVLAAIRDAGVLSAVGYSVRYLPASRVAKEYLADKTVAMCTVNRWGGLPRTPWWRVMDQSGGQLVEQTTHQVDLMRYFLGEIVEVHARYAQRALTDLPNFTVPDVQIATFLFESGAIGSVTTSCALTQGGGNSDMDFIMRDARLHFSAREATVMPETAEPLPEMPASLPNIDECFVQAVATGDPSHILCDYEDGLKSAAVTFAANESALLGQPVVPYFAR